MSDDQSTVKDVIVVAVLFVIVVVVYPSGKWRHVIHLLVELSSLALSRRFLRL